MFETRDQLVSSTGFQFQRWFTDLHFSSETQNNYAIGWWYWQRCRKLPPAASRRPSILRGMEKMSNVFLGRSNISPCVTTFENKNILELRRHNMGGARSQ